MVSVLTPALALLAALWMPVAAHSRDVAGRFDYYILALSWQPAWCSRTGDARGAPECAPGTGHGFTVHGLWPQNEEGWPEYCRTRHRDPSRRETAKMSDVMGSAGLAWHQWQKHGRCADLPAADYFDATRRAAGSIAIPEILERLPRDVSLPPVVIEQAILEANPALEADGVTVICRDGALAELRICLTRDLEPRRCAPDVRRDCARSRIVMEAPR